MRQWELDNCSLGAHRSMLFGNTGEHTVKPVFNIGDGQASHPHGQPGDSFAKIFYDLQCDLGVLKDHLFKLAAAETAGQGIFQTVGTDWVLPLFRKHVFTDKVTGLADIQRQFGAVFQHFGKLDASALNKKHFIGGISLQKQRLAGGRFFPQRLTTERFNVLCFEVLEYPQVADAG